MTPNLIAFLLAVISLVHALPSDRAEVSTEAQKNGFDFEEFLKFVAESPINLSPNAWKPFQLYLNAAGGYPTFRINVDSEVGQLQITDLYCQGDAFMLLITSNQGDMWYWSSSAPNLPSCDVLQSDPELAMEQGWSYSSIGLPGPAVYDVSIIGNPSPFGGGRGAIRWYNSAKIYKPSASSKA